MGLFNKMFNGSSDAEKKSSNAENTPWVELDRLEQLDEIVKASNEQPQLIFKHSTRCGISRMVISQFKKAYQLPEDQATLYYLDLLNHRNISQAIADRFKVMHESPQLLVIKDGTAVAHESHGAINNMDLSKFV